MSADRRELNRENTIRDIEDAFLALYETGGIDAVGVSRICEACGIARSTFYLYFEDKFAVLQRVEDRLLSKLLEIDGELPTVDDLAACDELAMRTLAHLRENIPWYRALLGDKGDPMFSFRLKGYLEEGLSTQLKRRRIEPREAAIRCVFFSSAIIGFYRYIVFQCPDMSNEELSTHMNDLLRFLTRPSASPG